MTLFLVATDLSGRFLRASFSTPAILSARYYVTDIGDADPVGRAHSELLGSTDRSPTSW